MKTYVLYHAFAVGDKAAPGCYDGFGAAWAAHRSFRGRDDYFQIEFIPVAYGLPVPKLNSGSLVYIVDFSYSREVLLDMAGEHQRVIVLDHHKTAKEALEGLEHPNLEIVFDMERSGAMITWQRMSQDPVPFLISAISDRDLWTFKQPGTKEIHTYLQSFPFDFLVWDKIYDTLEDPVKREAAIESGVAIVRFRDSQVKHTCEQAELHPIGGHDVPVVNATGFWSEVGHELLEQYPKHPFAVSWFRRKDEKVQLSFRSRKDFDCSVIAKTYGGGGHAQAAGATVDWDIWEMALRMCPKGV